MFKAGPDIDLPLLLGAKIFKKYRSSGTVLVLRIPVIKERGEEIWQNS
jgi:hypothetical protein